MSLTPTTITLKTSMFVWSGILNLLMFSGFPGWKLLINMGRQTPTKFSPDFSKFKKQEHRHTPSQGRNWIPGSFEGTRSLGHGAHRNQNLALRRLLGFNLRPPLPPACCPGLRHGPWPAWPPNTLTNWRNDFTDKLSSFRWAWVSLYCSHIILLIENRFP